MIRISGIKLRPNHTNEELINSIIKKIKIQNVDIIKYNIYKKSIDARNKSDIRIVYTIDVLVKNEEKLIKRINNPDVTVSKDIIYKFNISGKDIISQRPVIIGSGPAGLFCALALSENGYRPIVIERGEDVDNRIKSVNIFWENNKLNKNSNVQFGEGGAGTFSDGKLNTLVKDEFGRNKYVLQEFVMAGANEEILYINKPHIGTDVLRKVVKNLRQKIISLGGEFYFNSCVTDFRISNNCISKIEINNEREIDCEVVVLAIGHSARDTFELIYNKGVNISKKPFAIGVRIEHPQELINLSQYGNNIAGLPVADYKLTHKSRNGRGVYSFCMCPGGFVVNSSSEENLLVTNGMSNYKRDEKNANSALIVTVNPEDFLEDSPLSGVEFQRKWERLSYEIGNGKIPVQMFGDFKRNVESNSLGDIMPNMKGNYKTANLRESLPEYVCESLIEGVEEFNKRINGFSRYDALISGVETRTSSPVRIIRNDLFESNIAGLYPAGEGAGYAGGIMSAAMDGLKVAEAISKKYRP